MRCMISLDYRCMSRVTVPSFPVAASMSRVGVTPAVQARGREWSLHRVTQVPEVVTAAKGVLETVGLVLLLRIDPVRMDRHSSLSIRGAAAVITTEGLPVVERVEGL